MFNKKRQIRYWVKYLFTEPKYWRSTLEEIRYVIKHKPNPLCWLGFHKIKWDYDNMYYSPESFCMRCDEMDVRSYWMRYEDWSSYHTMHPLAWPWLIYMNLRFKFWEWVANRAQKD